MKRLALALACAAMSLPLTACGPLESTPAPLANTIIDEKAVTLAVRAVDTAALSASALVRAKVIVPGSPTALKLANALDEARRWVNAAAAAREAGNAASYSEAIGKADQALSAIRTALSGG